MGMRVLPHEKAEKPANNGEMSAFARHVSELLEHVEYRRCESGEDLEDIYRLRYDAYLAVGMIRPNASHKIIDEFDESPSAYRFGVYYDGHLVSTLRLHHVTAEFPDSPSVKVFKDVLMPRLQAGETFVDPSRFAANAEWAASLRVLPYITLRLAQVACRYFKPTACLTAIKEEHSAFYTRTLYAEPITEARTYPGLTTPVLLYQSPYPDAPDKVAARFPFFESTPMEQRMLFERREGELAPLTILPTAKYLKAAA
ncbi:MAG: hypothetical protein WDZ83_15525 [Rhizobiaceae bacterium]